MLKRISVRILICLALTLVFLIGAFYFSELLTPSGRIIKIAPSTVEAASNPTVYTSQGSSDNLVWQQALNALSTNGGEINAQAGSYITDVGSVVSRAVNYVTIAGQGLGTYYAGTISVGTQTGWIFRDIKIDSITGTSSYTLQNAMVAGVYYTYYTSALGNVIGETATQELDNKTLDSSVAKGTWTTSGTWTIPEVAVINDSYLSWKTVTGTVSNVLKMNSANNVILVNDAAGSINLFTDDASGAGHAISRLSITGNVASAVVTWMNCTQAGIVLGEALNANGHNLYGVTEVSRSGATTDALRLYGRGIASGDSALVVLRGSTDASANGAFEVWTPNAARDTSIKRLEISGSVDVAAATFNSLTTTLRNDVAGDSTPLTLQNLSSSGTPKVFFNMQLSNGILAQIGALVGQPSNNGGGMSLLVRNGATGYMSEVLRLTTEYSDAGKIRFPTYGAGTLTTDASGNITASSDARLKDIQETFTPGLKEVLNIDPVLYKWKSSTGLDTTNTYAGFSAQNVMQYIPQAVGLDSEGYYTLNDRAIIAALVNSVKDLQAQIDSLAGSTYNKAVPPDTSQTKIIKSPEKTVLIGPPAPTSTPTPTATPKSTITTK